MEYNQFCLVISKSSTSRLNNDFIHLRDKLFFKGQSIDSELIGNIHPYLREFKEFDESKREIFKDSILKNPIAFLNEFVGDFSFIQIIDNEIIAARDHLGVFPLFYYNDENYFIISNDQKWIIDIPMIDLSSDPQWMGEYVTGSQDSFENTFYKNIKKVPPAHLLIFKDGNISLEKYWELDLTKKSLLKTDEEYSAEFKRLLQLAIETRIPDTTLVGSEVSGGIDCTSVAAIAKNYLDRQNRKLHTYGHSSFDSEKFPSERGAIEGYLESLQPFKHTFIPKKLVGMREIAEHTFQLRNGVSHSHYSLFSKEIFESANSDGVQVVFSGLGGDHGVSFKGSGPVINDHIRLRKWRKAMKELKLIHKKNDKAFFYFCYYFLQVHFGLNFKRIDYSKIEDNKRKSLKVLREIFLDLKEYKIRKTERTKINSSTQQHVKNRLSAAELSNRCEATTIAASHFGVLYRYPLLDIRLLQFMVSLPSHMYYQNGINRYIFRQTIKDFVPPKIAFQPKPLSNMYGWILEAYKFDYENKLDYKLEPKDDELKLYYEFWKYRDDQCYRANNYFNDGKANDKF